MVSRYRRDAIVVLVLLALPLALFWQTTLGGKTLVPGDNLYQWEPFASYAGEQGVATFLTTNSSLTWCWKTMPGSVSSCARFANRAG